MTKIYVCITGDLFHSGHISFLKKARNFGDYLVVGVCSDEDVAAYKWPPILNLNQRVAVIESCNLVDEVIPNAPPSTRENFIKNHKIDLVIATKAYSEADLKKYYGDPLKMEILKLVDYHEGISTSSIVERCAEQFNLRKGLKKKI
tara:strand:+ start:1247 stop:1684 length:438 start_codon:yes stop_codon:yes gene_type:complete